MDKNISFTLKVWRQNGPKDKGHFDTFQMKDIPGDTSFLEMLDILNEMLIEEGKEPIVFDHDCREGICGMCSLYIIKDLMVDRSAYDKIMQAGGFVSVNTGAPQDANAILIPKTIADEAMDAATCIGCGACVAACKNGSAMLFVSAKVVLKLCCQRWMNLVSVTVQTLVLVRLNVLNAFQSAISPV